MKLFLLLLLVSLILVSCNTPKENKNEEVETQTVVIPAELIETESELRSPISEYCRQPKKEIGFRCCTPYEKYSDYCADEYIDLESKTKESIDKKHITKINTIIRNKEYGFYFDAPASYLLVENTYRGAVSIPYLFLAFGEDSKGRLSPYSQISIQIFYLEDIINQKNIEWSEMKNNWYPKQLMRTNKGEYVFVKEVWKPSYTRTIIFRDRPIILQYNSPLGYERYVKDFDRMLHSFEFKEKISNN